MRCPEFWFSPEFGTTHVICLIIAMVRKEIGVAE
jgi:hypothetical protein